MDDVKPWEASEALAKCNHLIAWLRRVGWPLDSEITVATLIGAAAVGAYAGNCSRDEFLRAAAEIYDHVKAAREKR